MDAPIEPIRVLHLVDPGRPGAGACTLRLVADAARRVASVRQQTIVVGTAQHESLARSCGIEPAGRVTPPAGRTILARAAVHRAIEALEAEHGPFDVVHAWSTTVATLAAAVGGDRHRLATLAVGPLDGLETEAFGAALLHAPMPLLALGHTVRHEFAVAGVDRDLLLVLPPGVDAESLPEAAERERERGRLRARWGAGPGTLAVGLLGEPVRWADAKAAASVLTLVALGGHDIVLVVHPSAERRAEAERYVESLGLGDRLVLEEAIAEPWRMVAGLDAALLMSDETTVDHPRPLGSAASLVLGGGRARRPMTGTLSLLWAAAAGVPVVAEATLAARAYVEEGVNGFLVERRDVYQAANRLIRLAEDPQLRGRVGAAAAAHARQRANVSAFCVRLKSVWERLASGRPLLILGDAERAAVEFGGVAAGRRADLASKRLE